MKEIIIGLIGITLILLALDAIDHHHSPYQSCVRALMSDKESPMSEANAHLYCAKAMHDR